MDSYSRYWNPCYKLLKKYLHNHGQIIFLSEDKEPDFVNEVRHIKTGKGEWGRRLLYALNQINSELIIYMQEDFWASSHFTLTDNLVELFYKYNMIQLHIKERVGSMGIIYENTEGNLYKMGQNSTYTHHHQFAIWKKDIFKNNILPDESPWQNEINGTERMNKKPHNIYLLENRWYTTTCRKGILIDDGKYLLKKENLKF